MQKTGVLSVPELVRLAQKAGDATAQGAIALKAHICSSPQRRLKNSSTMKTILQFGVPREVAVLLLLLYCLAAADGRAADSVALPPEASAAEAILSQARLSLAEARKAQSDPRTAVGHYLDAADASVRSVGVSSGNGMTEETRSIYDAASQEVAVLLRSSTDRILQGPGRN